jgi:hypothetical protein
VKLTFLLLLFLSGCTNLATNLPLHEGKTNYSYSDVSGSFHLQREVKKVKLKLVTRQHLLDKNAGQKLLEKSVAVSQLGTVSSKHRRVLAMKPLASEFTVWLEGKKYSSSMSTNSNTRSMTVKLDGPEPKWQGVQEIKFPKSKYFCFFSQVPECLHQLQLLKLAQGAPDKAFEFYIIWESWPYIQEQLTNVGTSLFSSAELKFEGSMKGQLRFIVDVDGQIILYHFSKSYDLVKIAWVAQGISVVPPGEDDVQHEE